MVENIDRVQSYLGTKCNFNANTDCRNPKLNLPDKLLVWQRMSSDGDEFIEVGEVFKGDVAFSAKMGLSGRLKFKIGKYKENGPLIGEAKDKSIFGSTCIISLPDGFSTKCSKNRSLSNSTYTVAIPVNGVPETFEWQPKAKSLKQKLKGESGWCLVREGSHVDAPPLATFSDDEGSGLRSKTKMGVFEFQGPRTKQDLGDQWAAIALISVLKIKQRQIQAKAVKAVAGAA
jgi:hypothetical protein